MNLAYLKNNVVRYVAPNGYAPPANWDYDATRDGTGAGIDYTWNGSAYVAPPVPPEVANQRTLEQQADDALAANIAAITDIQSDIAQANAWLAANTGTLTTAQLSTAMRTVMQKLVNMGQRQVTSCQQRNGVIRLLRGKFDATN